MELIEYLANFNGEFNASLGESGGYITFSNSGRRGNIKYFQISLDSLKKTIEDILDNISIFENIQDYVEKNWRDNGSSYFSDEVANAMITVQTKPLFSTLSKLIKWGNEPTLDSVDDTSKMIITQVALENTLQKLKNTIQQYTPKTVKLQYGSFGSNGLPLQTIYYGAPGTGKSHKVKGITEVAYPDKDEREKFVFRTTFHPDYDYTSFVGCYKPKAKGFNMLAGENLTEEQLLQKFSDSANGDDKKAKYLYEALIRQADMIRLGIDGKSLASKLKDKGFSNCTYDVECAVMAKIYDFLVKDGYVCENKITYSFIPQVFTKAYIKAWEEMKQESPQPIYLVIEEINRGNCAQIFGDIFQLLDRNENGYSEYPIDIDEDLKNYLVQQLGTDSEGIKDGKLCLPPNLNFLATMNTSDQSLFPMDSAFKRRWDWEFVPIRYSADKADDKDNFHTFTITVGDKDKGNVSTYLWTDFLQNINKKILSVTDSEDKQMGEYFIKKSVDEKTFINKVMYYLWSEVGKDLYGSTNPFFVQKTKNGNEQDVENQFSFNDLFKGNATELLIGFMKKLEVKSKEEKAAEKAAPTAE